MSSSLPEAGSGSIPTPLTLSAPDHMPGALELSVVIPCLNEAETIGQCVSKALGYFARHHVAGEVIVADNGSTDGSQRLAEAAGARVVPIPQRGYGSALAGGIAAARGRFIVMGDADDSYDLSALQPFLEKLREGFDLVMGNRFRGGIAPGAMPFLHRYLGNPVLSFLGRLFFGSPVGDFHCGLRGFSKAAFERMQLRTSGMEFASEMVVKATLLGLRITEVPTTLSPAGRSRPPHLRTWRDGWRHLRFLLLYSPNWLFLYPGLALMGAGMLLGLWLLPGPRQVGHLQLDVHTLLYAGLAVLLGFQSVLFAILSRVFAFAEGLLPEAPVLSRLFRFITLEAGLVTGVLLVLIGLGVSALAVHEWSQASFGPLNPSTTLRAVIPACVCLAVGVQTILFSFFLSVLGLRRR